MKPTPYGHLLCSHVMAVGTRRNRRRTRATGSVTRGRGDAVVCPARATRLFDGVPYCSTHAPRSWTTRTDRPDTTDSKNT